jgi:hypothetical protein
LQPPALESASFVSQEIADGNPNRGLLCKQIRPRAGSGPRENRWKNITLRNLFFRKEK